MPKCRISFIIDVAGLPMWSELVNGEGQEFTVQPIAEDPDVGVPRVNKKKRLVKTSNGRSANSPSVKYAVEWAKQHGKPFLSDHPALLKHFTDNGLNERTAHGALSGAAALGLLFVVGREGRKHVYSAVAAHADK